MHTVIIPNVKKDRMEYYRAWAQTLGRQVISIAKEDDGEFTIVILMPND